MMLVFNFSFSDSDFWAFSKTLFLLLASILITTAVFSQECGYVYVSHNGVSSGVAGTKANPASLTYGLTLADSTNNIVRLGAGTYDFSSAFNIESLFVPFVDTVI